MTRPIVVMLYSQSLFAAGIESRLSRFDDLEIVHVDASSDALLQITEICPRVVIIDVNDQGVILNAPVQRLLKDGAKVIGMDLNCDEISIYQQEGRLALTGADLAKAIREQMGGGL